MSFDSKPRTQPFFRRVACLCLGLVGWALFVACTPPGTAPTPLWEVQPGLYSGRENPHRVLTVEEAQQFEAMLAELPAGVVSERGGLGYQGFIIRRVGAAGTNGITGVIVYDGIAQVNHTSGVYYLGDPDRALEGWLFDRSKGILSESEIQLIEADLQP